MCDCSRKSFLGKKNQESHKFTLEKYTIHMSKNVRFRLAACHKLGGDVRECESKILHFKWTTYNTAKDVRMVNLQNMRSKGNKGDRMLHLISCEDGK